MNILNTICQFVSDLFSICKVSRASFKNIFKKFWKKLVAIFPHHFKYGFSAWRLKRYSPFNLLSNCRTIIQVGASGRLCDLGRSQPIIFSKLIDVKGKIHAFDVLPENIDGLKAYLSAYNISNITCHLSGIWKQKGILEFSAPYRAGTGSVIKEVRPELVDKYSTTRYLSVDSIDNLVEANGIDSVDFINITINGAELEAIEGAEKIISRYNPIICMVYPNTNIERIVTILKTFGYDMHFESIRLHLFGKLFKILWAKKTLSVYR